MRSRKKLGLIALAIGLALSGCSSLSQAQNEAPALLEPVSVAENTIPVQRRDLYVATSLDVSVVPKNTKLYFSMDGKISSVTVTEGQLVKKGDVLAQIDQTDLLESIKQLQE